MHPGERKRKERDYYYYLLNLWNSIKTKGIQKKAITNIPVNKTNKSMITKLHQRKIETQTNYLIIVQY